MDALGRENYCGDKDARNRRREMVRRVVWLCAMMRCWTGFGG